MACRCVVDNDATIVFYVSELLTKSELDESQQEAEKFIQEGVSRVLVLATDFEGWDNNSGDWTDLEFGQKNDSKIEKMAIVGEQQWRDLSEMFTLKGFRSFPIEYFLPSEYEKAITWLES